MSWTDEKITKLKELWGKGRTASQIAEIIGGITRNAVIGKAHRLNLSAKIRNKTNAQRNSNNLSGGVQSETNQSGRKSRRSKFKSLLLSKDYEPAKNLTLEELTDETCKYIFKAISNIDKNLRLPKSSAKASSLAIASSIIFLSFSSNKGKFF